MEIVSKSQAHRIPSFIRDDDFFLKGWWGAESDNQKEFRWSKGRSFCFIKGHMGENLTFEIFSSYPNIEKKSVCVFFLNHKSKELICSVVLYGNLAEKITIPLNDNQFVLQIFCDLTWILNLLIDTLDSRELGIGIYNVSIQ